MNIYDILILTAVAAVFVLAVWRIASNRKKGKLCGGNCACCSEFSKCGRKNEKE
ncbi:MAG: FeoB-associated Cys-rich membrane protein [Ruminococcaceae bacterium]|nr:FeoB-associated Cys-rich membrane protein [Oscillospiraceae bacterium]